MKRAIITIFGFLLVQPGIALAQQTTQPYYHHSHMWGGGWFFGPIMGLAFVALAVVIIVLLVRWLGGDTGSVAHPHTPPGKTPIDILKERFAKGEIDKEDFEERKKLLE